MKTRGVLLLATFLVLCAGFTDARSSTAGETAVASTVSTVPPKQAQAGEIEALLEPLREKHSLPALAAAVIVGGKPAVIGVVGERRVGSGVPVTREDQFHLGSCTKAMTATLIGILVERGDLRWDLTLAEAFPEFADSMHAGYRAVTLKHLLSHRAGLPAESWPAGMNFLTVHMLPGTPRQQRHEYARRMLSKAPEADPGTKYIYANAGFAIAGAVAEKIENAEWEQLMRDEIFTPLGMKSPGFGAMGTPGKVDQPYQHRLTGGRREVVEPGPLSDNPPAIGPAGTVHCSIGDWAKFVQDHLSRGRKSSRLLRPETYRTMWSPPFGGDYAMGWVVTRRPWGGGDVLMHNGSNNMNFCVVWMAPKRNFAVLVATNIGGKGVDKMCDEVAWALIQRFLPAREGD